MSERPFFENVTIITGASSGIGRELAYHLADQGAWLALAARSKDRLQEVAQECHRRGGQALVLQTDVSQEEQCRALVKKTYENYGRINTLINNAGITMWSHFEDLQTLAPLETIMQVNYMGSVYCTFYALPYLKETRGLIVAISSLTGKTGVPTRSGYAASKHAMVGFFDSLRIELAGHGVGVSIVYPDFVATETRMRAFGPDGVPLERSPIREERVMTVETCAQMTIKAMSRRQRELILSTRGKIGQWIKLVAPGVIDNIAQRAVSRRS